MPRLGLPCLDQLQERQGLGHNNNQPPSAAGGGCAAVVVVSKPLPLLELVKARQTEPRQGTASEAAEARQSIVIYMPVVTGWKGGELIFRFRGIL